jgi:hypothetical protein
VDVPTRMIAGADGAVLGARIRTLDPRRPELPDVPVRLTVVDGEVVHRAGE